MAKLIFLCLCGYEFETDGYPIECPKCGLILFEEGDSDENYQR